MMKDDPIRQVLGGLLYLYSRSIWYIATAVSIIAKYQSKARPVQWNMAKDVSRHLIGTANYGIARPNRN